MNKRIRPFRSFSLIVRENPRALIMICACLFFSSLLEGIGIAAVFPLISSILETGTALPPSKITDFINLLSAQGPILLCVFIIVCFILKALVLHLTMAVVAKNVANFSHKMRISFVEAILKAKTGYIFSKSLGQNLSILTSDSINAGAAYISAARVLSGFFQVLLYFIYALWLSVEATLLSMATAAILGILIKTTMSRSAKAGNETTQHIHGISRNMAEALRGVKEAKATARENYFLSYIVEGSLRLRKAHTLNITLAQTLRNIQDPVTIASALLCILIFKYVVDLEPGYILFILAVYYRLMTSMNMMLSDYQKFSGQEASLRSIREGIKLAQQEEENISAGGLTPDAAAQTIYFNDVSMSYGEKKVFSLISFTVPACKLTVFKGQSGRGKTTCIDIICRLVEPTSGKILIGSKNLQDINAGLWRQKIGYVDQFPFLFKGTIRENILLDLKGVSDTQILNCIKLCHLEQFVGANSEGLDYVLQEGGANISGGQRQRIAIARSIIRNPQYLILDEPTSALDQDSAQAVFETLKELSMNMTVIVISHSANSDAYADNIINFDAFLEN